MALSKIIEKIKTLATTGPGINYARIEARIRELAASYAKGEVTVDTIPEGSYLKVQFDVGTPSGTSGDVSLPITTNTFYAIEKVYIEADSIVKPQLYITLINGSEKPMIESPLPGGTYYIEGIPVIQSLRFHAELGYNATSVVRAKALYNGLVFQISKVV